MKHAHVLAYFADDPTRSYQLIQWLPVLEQLDQLHPVAVVARDERSAEVLDARTRLPIVLATSFPELTELYAASDAKVVLYCNNSMLNFHSLLDGRKLHVHINHGESDKQSMASNNAKAYDRVFVAGEAAVQRHEVGLLEFDTDRLVRIGRPQLDLRPPALLEPTARRTVLYAPTWEGDAEYNDYTSLDTLGVDIARAVLAVADARLVYKPHPKVATSETPAVRDAHRAILAILDEAVRRDPSAGHRAITVGDILAVIPDCDAMVTDVSSVGLDWLYLRTEKPIFLTDRHLRPRAAAAGRAGQPVRGRAGRGGRRRPDCVDHRPARSRRAPSRSRRDAAPLLRRPAGRREHDTVRGVGVRAGRPPGPARRWPRAGRGHHGVGSHGS